MRYLAEVDEYIAAAREGIEPQRARLMDLKNYGPA
jgi:hypothetical protein